MEKNETIDVDPRLMELHRTVAQAVYPEDIFGKRLCFLSDNKEEREPETREEEREALHAAWKEWERSCSYFLYAGKYVEPFADEVSQMLTRLYNEALARIDEGEYGQELGSDFRVDIGDSTIELRKFIADIDISEVYAGSFVVDGKYGRKVIVKLAKEPENNRFLENEIRALRLLFEKENKQDKHYQFAERTFKDSDGRLGVISDYRADYYSLEEVRNSQKWHDGTPEKHMVWMLNRALSGIGYAHKNYIIHRDLNPQNVIIRPRDHNLVFTNWDHALLNAHTNPGEPFTGQDGYTAPEIKSGEKAHPSSDLYSIGKLMIYVLGGDPVTNEMPSQVNPRIQSFLKSFVLESKWQRAGDAWETHAELISLIEDLWGKRKFLKFSIY